MLQMCAKIGMLCWRGWIDEESLYAGGRPGKRRCRPSDFVAKNVKQCWRMWYRRRKKKEQKSVTVYTSSKARHEDVVVMVVIRS